MPITGRPSNRSCGIALVLHPAAVHEAVACPAGRTSPGCGGRRFFGIHRAPQCAGRRLSTSVSRTIYTSDSLSMPSDAMPHTVIAEIFSRAQHGAPATPACADRRVFITGGGSGIGAMPRRWRSRDKGARVVAFVDVTPKPRAAGAASRSGSSRPDCRGPGVASLRRTRCRGAAAAPSAMRPAALGDFHVLVNNVASDDRQLTVESSPPSYYDERIAVNQRPAFFAIQAWCPA